MHVYLIRHAQSENNALSPENIHQRKVDPGLTELGYRQREALGDFLASEAQSFAIDHLYTSAMYRSLLTTEPVCAALNLRPRVWLDLHEKGGMFLRQNGRVDGFGGLSRSVITSQFPDYLLPDAITDAGWYDAALGYEPEAHSAFRAIKVANELIKRSRSEEVIAMVSHAGFLDTLLKAIFGQLPSQAYSMRYYHNNTAITRVDFDGRRPILHYLNRVDHLPPAMRSY
ncbi:MAG: histidine phosphatase family protein [Chloroflexi bacterium]|nr:histidine phosphatase family protein [Chloroflexota bacterium]